MSAQIKLHKHEVETLWIVLIFMGLLYASMSRVETISGDAGLFGKLADAYLTGQTHLLEEPPPSLLHSANPYIVKRGSPEMRYSDWLLYDGKFYLPYGPTPVLTAFLPYKFITGHDLSLNFVTFAWACGGTIFLLLIFHRLSRLLEMRNDRFFRIVALLLMAGTFLPIGLSLPSHYQVSLTGAYFFTALTLWCLLHSLAQSKYHYIYLLIAGLGLGLAAGCRLHFIFAGILVPLAALYWLHENRWRFSKEIFLRCLFFALPWALCVIGLLYYNDIRFGSPFDTGLNHQLTWKSSAQLGHWRADRIGINLYFYFLNPLPLTASFPFFAPLQCCNDLVTVPWHTSANLATQEPVYGAFTNAPFMLFSFLSLWMLKHSIASPVKLLIFALWSVILAVMPILLIMQSTMRYLVDFAPYLMLLACVGYGYLWSRSTDHRLLSIIGCSAALWTLVANLAYGSMGFMHITYFK